MKNKEIYDRKELCEELIKQIKDAKETQAYILYSGIGIGKTSVSQKLAKLINENKINKDVILIKSALDSTIQEGAFIKYIFESIKKYYLINSKKRKSKKRKNSFAYYIGHQNFRIFKNLIEQAYQDNKEYHKFKISIFQIIKIICQFIFLKIGLLEEVDTTSIDNKLMLKYIKYILKKEKIVLCIENSQYFDNSSLEALIELLIENKHRSIYVIFEFTLEENSKNLASLSRIEHELDYSEIAYKESELEKLDLQYVLKLAKQCCKSADHFFVQEIERIYTGNIQKVVNYAFNYSVQTVCDSDSTLMLLQTLSNDQKYIMAVILLNNTIIHISMLKKVLENTNDIYLSDFNKDINYLVDTVQLVDKKDNYVYIKDRDTIDSWNKNIKLFTKYEGLAYKNCESIFRRILDNGMGYSISSKECILLLLQLYSKFDPIKLHSMLMYINDIIYEFISIEELEKYLKQLIDVLYLKEQSLNILYDLFDICNRNQLIDLEAACLDKIKMIMNNQTNEKYLFCYFTYLLQKEEYQFLLDEILTFKEMSVNTVFKYYVELFKIAALSSLNNIEECQKVVNTLENDLFFQKSIPYGYFLRLAEAYAQRDIAIFKVENSVAVFKQFSMNTQVAKSQVSLAFLYAITGNLRKAQSALDSAEKILLKNIENKHVFNINKACLCLLNHNYSEEVWVLLNESEKYAHMRFDKIAIIINKLIWCIENKDYEKGKYYVKKGLELLELEYNRHLHAIFFYNCHVLYNSINERMPSKKYYDLAVKNKEYCKTLKARLEGKKEVEDQTTFLLQYPWHVCFVSYWYVDFIYENM